MKSYLVYNNDSQDAKEILEKEGIKFIDGDVPLIEHEDGIEFELVDVCKRNGGTIDIYNDNGNSELEYSGAFSLDKVIDQVEESVIDGSDIATVNKAIKALEEVKEAVSCYAKVYEDSFSDDMFEIEDLDSFNKHIDVSKLSRKQAIQLNAALTNMTDEEFDEIVRVASAVSYDDMTKRSAKNIEEIQGNVDKISEVIDANIKSMGDLVNMAHNNLVQKVIEAEASKNKVSYDLVAKQLKEASVKIDYERYPNAALYSCVASEVMCYDDELPDNTDKIWEEVEIAIDEEDIGATAVMSQINIDEIEEVKEIEEEQEEVAEKKIDDIDEINDIFSKKPEKKAKKKEKKRPSKKFITIIGISLVVIVGGLFAVSNLVGNEEQPKQEEQAQVEDNRTPSEKISIGKELIVKDHNGQALNVKVVRRVQGGVECEDKNGNTLFVSDAQIQKVLNHEQEVANK